MIRLINKKLIIPRGDTGSFSLPALTSLSENDKAIFSIIDTRTNRILLPKECTYENNILTVEFTHEQTVNLPVGKFYWDIKIYQDAQIIEQTIVSGREVNSYYAAYQLPVCEIRQTGDRLLTMDNNGTSITNTQDFNLLNAILNEVQNIKTIVQGYKEEIETMLNQDERLTSIENSIDAINETIQALTARIVKLERGEIPSDTLALGVRAGQGGSSVLTKEVLNYLINSVPVEPIVQPGDTEQPGIEQPGIEQPGIEQPGT